MKQILLCDVDGVCNNLVYRLREYCDLPIDWESDCCSSDLLKGLDWAQRGRVIEALATEEFWRDLQPSALAQNGIDRLRDAGWHVTFLTAPWPGLRTWTHIRTQWLWKHFGASFEDIIFTTRKELVYGDVLIEDSAHNTEKWQEFWGKKPILLARAYNRGRHTWNDVIKELSQPYRRPCIPPDSAFGC
jgi:5'(3')-deoxyribonucleotidase